MVSEEAFKKQTSNDLFIAIIIEYTFCVENLENFFKHLIIMMDVTVHEPKISE